MPVHYLTQAAAGQDQLQRSQLSIDEIEAKGWYSGRTRALLAEVAVIKAYGEAHGLKATKSYRTYVELHRPEVLWVTTACDPLAFRPRAWRFPIIGSITYLGWFKRSEADTFASELREKGWDVDVRPSQAYSTLGWFDDPVLSSMLGHGVEARGELADVILHESLHATFYVNGQSTLNESIASFVGDTLALTYLDEHVGATSPEKTEYESAERDYGARGEAFKGAYAALEALYASPLSKEEKLREKARITTELRDKTHVKRPINNATLIQYKTYGSGRAELVRMFAACEKSWPKFLAALASLKPALEHAKEQEDPGTLLAPYAEKCGI